MDIYKRDIFIRCSATGMDELKATLELLFQYSLFTLMLSLLFISQTWSSNCLKVLLLVTITIPNVNSIKRGYVIK